MPALQTTLAAAVGFEGTGVHTGRPARLRLCPAGADHGIRFRRMDLGGVTIPARWDAVILSPLNTRIADRQGNSVSTIEHLMAALAGTGVHNALVEIDGPEVPIMDGSAAPFVRGILAAGMAQLPAPLSVIEVLREVGVTDGKGTAALAPATSLQIDFEIDFPDAAIGHQQLVRDLRNGAFVRDLCDSRTFCRRADVERLRAEGLALGGTFENAVVVEGDKVLTPGGLRHPDEAVRHKMLDVLGDLALAGAPILGRYTGRRAGHALTNRLLHALFADRDAWRLVPCGAGVAARLPGTGITPRDLARVA
ncbi:MAG: UDP-3-O-acyl-N-acetylglucosamine deacetylase [Rubellimicrobium sp.]|nr:UDP-3-O-acyl-N-acetylglucosamine deacetylase [Rubellimicrobium sp.]